MRKSRRKPWLRNLSDGAILDNYIRGQIYGFITGKGIVYYSEIRKELNLNNGVASHHLRVLEDRGIIKSVKRDGRKYFYKDRLPAGFLTEPNNEVERGIMNIVEERPGTYVSNIRKELGISPSIMSYHMKRLSEKKSVRVENDGAKKQLFLPGPLDI